MSLLWQTQNALLLTTIALIRALAIFLFWSPGDGERHKWYLLVQWFEIRERNSELREHKCLLLQQETLILLYCMVSISDFFLREEHYLYLSKLFSIQISLEKYFRTKAARHADMQENDRKLSLNRVTVSREIFSDWAFGLFSLPEVLLEF